MQHENEEKPKTVRWPRFVVVERVNPTNRRRRDIAVVEVDRKTTPYLNPDWIDAGCVLRVLRLRLLVHCYGNRGRQYDKELQGAHKFAERLTVARLKWEWNREIGDRKGGAKKSDAEILSTFFGDDGQSWLPYRTSKVRLNDGRKIRIVAPVEGVEESGTNLEGVLEMASVKRETHAEHDLVRYELPDGSAIVIGGGVWDIEGNKPFLWKGVDDAT